MLLVLVYISPIPNFFGNFFFLVGVADVLGINLIISVRIVLIHIFVFVLILISIYF